MLGDMAVTESDVVSFFHASRAAAKAARRRPEHLERMLAMIEARVDRQWADWREARIANAKAWRDAYERSLET